MPHKKTFLTLILISYIAMPNTIHAGKWINWNTIITDICSCITEIADSIKNAISHEKISITGTKIIQTKKIAIPDVHTITVSGSALAIITQDSSQTEELTIEADEAVMPHIDVQLHNNELIIKLKKNVSTYTTSQNIYHINIKSLLKINTVGAINVQIKNIDVPTVSMNVSGSSKITGSLSVEQLNIDATGACNITLTGNATKQNITIAGSSIFDGHNVQGKNMIIQGSGAVRVYSNVSDSIDGDLSGSGSLMYLGSPIVNVHATKAVAIASITK